MRAAGDWIVPGSGKTSQQEVIARAAKASVVLLGETHVNADHHRWQLQTLVALHAQRPNMVIGFEMFPRRVQAALDKWIAGELSEKEFLRAAEWDQVWNTDANLYLPLFHFARMNRIPMLALNIETSLRRQVAEKGFYGVPVEEREGLTRPAEPSQAYVDFCCRFINSMTANIKMKPRKMIRISAASLADSNCGTALWRRFCNKP